MVVGDGGDAQFFYGNGYASSHFQMSRQGGGVLRDYHLYLLFMYPVDDFVGDDIGVKVDVFKQLVDVRIGIEKSFFLSPEAFGGEERHFHHQRIMLRIKIPVLILSGDDEDFMAHASEYFDPLFGFQGNTVNTADTSDNDSYPHDKRFLF